eukprot:UN28636
MCLMDVKEKLRGHVYTSNEELAKDVRLVFANIQSFHNGSSEEGARLINQAKTLLAKFNKQYDTLVKKHAAEDAAKAEAAKPKPEEKKEEDQKEYEVERILEEKSENSILWYMVKWVGHKDPTWENAEKLLLNAKGVVDDWVKQKPTESYVNSFKIKKAAAPVKFQLKFLKIIQMQIGKLKLMTKQRPITLESNLIWMPFCESIFLIKSLVLRQVLLISLPIAKTAPPSTINERMIQRKMIRKRLSY